MRWLSLQIFTFHAVQIDDVMQTTQNVAKDKGFNTENVRNHLRWFIAFDRFKAIKTDFQMSISGVLKSFDHFKPNIPFKITFHWYWDGHADRDCAERLEFRIQRFFSLSPSLHIYSSEIPIVSGSKTIWVRCVLRLLSNIQFKMNRIRYDIFQVRTSLPRQKDKCWAYRRLSYTINTRTFLSNTQINGLNNDVNMNEINAPAQLQQTKIPPEFRFRVKKKINKK